MVHEAVGMLLVEASRIEGHAGMIRYGCAGEPAVVEVADELTALADEVRRLAARFEIALQGREPNGKANVG